MWQTRLILILTGMLFALGIVGVLLAPVTGNRWADIWLLPVIGYAAALLIGGALSLWVILQNRGLGKRSPVEPNLDNA